MSPPEKMTNDEQLKYLISFYDLFEQWKADKQKQVEQIDSKLLAFSQCLSSDFRPFVNHVVKAKSPPGSNEREKYEARSKKTIEIGLNSFYFPANFLEVDFLSDSGSAAMDAKQWAQLMQGDESYGSNEGWPIFNDTIAEVFGQRFSSVFLGKHPDAALNAKYCYKKNFNYLVNQGRGAESVLFAALADNLIFRDYEKLTEQRVTYYILCSNNFFDTTAGHIINIKDRSVIAPNKKEFKVTFQLMNFPNEKVKNGTYSESDRYLGDGDYEKLEKFVNENHLSIGCVFTTITNNSGGSQPVSLQHIQAISKLVHSFNLMYVMDSCRFAENCFLIKQLENSPLKVSEIVKQVFDCVDAFTISLKKDGISNCGGAICFAPASQAVQQFLDQKGGCLLQQIMDTVILQVGHFTYGALTGRDIKAVCQGLKQVIQEDYLQGRIGQVHHFAAMLTKLGVPVLQPCGTSAVYLDIDKFFDLQKNKHLRGNYHGNSIVGLCLCAGIRVCELGVSAFSSPHGNAPYAKPEDVSGNFVRLAIPRQLYSDADLYRAALWLAFLYEKRDLVKPVVDRPGLRHLSLHHFKMMFDFAK